MGFAFWFRFLNIALSVFVVALCVLKLVWNDQDRARAARIAGLGILTAMLAWITYDMRYQPFHIRIPIITLGLLLSAYGLNTMSIQPESFKKEQK